MTTDQFTLQVRRTYPHPQDVLFKAWTDPSALARWICPNPELPVVATVDLAVGGSYRIEMGHANPWIVTGVYEEVVAPSKLTFTWQWLHPREDEISLVTVEFHMAERGTEVLLTQSRLDSAESKEGHEESWTACFDRIEKALV